MAAPIVLPRDLLRLHVLDSLVKHLSARTVSLHKDELRAFYTIAEDITKRTDDSDHVQCLAFAIRCLQALEDGRYAWTSPDEDTYSDQEVVKEFEDYEFPHHSLAWLVEKSIAATMTLAKRFKYELTLWDAVHGTMARLHSTFDEYSANCYHQQHFDHVRDTLKSVTSTVSVIYQMELEPEVKLLDVAAKTPTA